MGRSVVLVVCWMALFPASALAVIPAIGPGSQGGQVATWQATLDLLIRDDAKRPAGLPKAERVFVGQRVLAVDGVFGPLTTRATRAYQRAYHLRPTGVVGVTSWKAWIGSRLTCCDAGFPTLARGVRSHRM
jgi:peptidoglycan hydrolase-like protein with peptidoglycan-binding domain